MTSENLVTAAEGTTLQEAEVMLLPVGEENKVLLEGGQVLQYDYMIIATGTETRPDETPGLKDKLWYKSIFDFYTIEGACALQKYFKNFEGGKLVMCISEVPYKCPVAPIEFVCLAEAYFTKKAMNKMLLVNSYLWKMIFRLVEFTKT